ncbi:MAG: hypothetical protein A2X32_08125 [Elusimicrobia bacterium GWC2_64_44]|nr:MAG: hypothetical protein A2X32_08125 [Elusimicrobia bacterium GWC2_64_44]
MKDELDHPDNIKCPYCGADNSVESVFCGACYKNLQVPKEARAEAAARRLLAGAAKAAPPAAPVSGPDEAPAVRLWGRAAIIAGLFAFYLQWLRKPNYFSFLDFINLAFHEAGHVFLGFFGRFIMMLGGTIFQLLLPALCLLQLRRKRSNIGWQLCVFWIGESLLNISIYAGDAIKQELPLVGGGEHDWTYLLTELGLIAHTPAVAKAIFLLGSAVIFYSFYLIGIDAKNREPFELGDLQLR